MRKKELIRENEKLIYQNEVLSKDVEFERDYKHILREDLDELRLLVAVISEKYNIDNIVVSQEDKERLQYHFSIECKNYKEIEYKINLPKPKKGRPKKVGK